MHPPRCTHSHVRGGSSRPPGREALPAGADRGHGWRVNARIKPNMVVNANTSARTTADHHACSTMAAASMRIEDAADAAHAMSRRQRPDAVAARMNSTRSVRRSVSTVITLAAIGLLGGADAQSNRAYCTQVNDQVSPKDTTKENIRMKAHTRRAVVSAAAANATISAVDADSNARAELVLVRVRAQGLPPTPTPTPTLTPSNFGRPL